MIESMLLKAPPKSTPYLGEILAGEFIDGDALATAVGLTAGTSINATAGWLKFNDGGAIKYIAKKPLRYDITWGSLNTKSLVTGKNIVIGGKTYKVRLLKGFGAGKTLSTGYDISNTVGSEWNRLLYHVSGKPFVRSSNTLASELITEGDWAKISEADMVMVSTFGVGSYCWVQESGIVGGYTQYGVRGYNGVSYATSDAGSGSSSIRGWRPCLELIG